MAKEPSTGIEKQQELYANMFEDSADQVYSDHMQESVNSEDPVDKLDCAKYNKIPLTAAEQNTAVDVISVNGIEYEAVNKLHHTKYTKISSTVTEQNTEIDEEGMNVIEYEGDDFDQHPVDEHDSEKYARIASTVADGFNQHSIHKLHCAEYTKIPSALTEQNTEVDAEEMNVIEYEAGDFDQHSYQLQNTEVQEGSFDQQIHDSVKDAESAAISMKLRSRPVKKLKMVCTHCKLTISFKLKGVSHIS